MAKLADLPIVEFKESKLQLLHDLECLESQIARKSREVQDKKIKLDTLQKRLITEKNNLAKAVTYTGNLSVVVAAPRDLSDSKAKITKYKRILIQHIVSIFRLRKVTRKHKNSSNELQNSIEYRIVTVGNPNPPGSFRCI